MPTDKNDNPLANYFWRSGERIAIAEVPDRFSVRMKRAVPASTVSDRYAATYRRRLRRQNLEVFAVDSSQRDAVMEQVRRGKEAQFASHVYALQSEPETRLYLTDQITVQFKPEVSDTEIEQLAASAGLLLLKEVAGMARTYVFQVGPQATENPIKIANRLAASDKVVSSEPNVAIASKSQYIPSDTLFPQQWHLSHTGGPLLAAESHIDVTRAWDITRGERSTIVAVADDSCDTSHVDFQVQGKIVFPRDFSGQDFDPAPELSDDNHGTACCGVAVAEESGIGTVGVAPGCALMPIRTSGYIDDESIEDMCNWVIDHGAGVLSCSWSAAGRYFKLSMRMQNALNRAATVGRGGKGCVLVFAAGNENRPVNGSVNESGWPNNTPNGPTQWLNGFAAHPEVVAVAASSSLATKSAYSNWGTEISVCAPSNNVRPATHPRVSVPVNGRGIVTTDRVGPSGYSSNDYTFDFGGTSSACPTVAGMAGLILSANPDLTAQEVREIIKSTTDKIVDNSADPQLGNRFGSYDANGHSPWFGHGRINAFKAVSEALRRRQGATGQVIKGGSKPAMTIPDNDSIGVRDYITLNQAANIAAIQIAVDLTHTYIGDLSLTLIAPSGNQIILHQRQGANAKNLKRSFDAASTPGLAALAGQSAAGQWVLWVQDLAAADTGKLNRWDIEITPSAKTVIEVQESLGVLIPDNDPAGIERTLNVVQADRLADIEVSVDITHTYIGDLTVTLVSPAGTAIALHKGTGGSQDNLIATYKVATTSGLQTLRGQPVQGAWKLRVADTAAVDIGKLNLWALKIATQ